MASVCSRSLYKLKQENSDLNARLIDVALNVLEEHDSDASDDSAFERDYSKPLESEKPPRAPARTPFDQELMESLPEGEPLPKVLCLSLHKFASSGWILLSLSGFYLLLSCVKT